MVALVARSALNVLVHPKARVIESLAQVQERTYLNYLFLSTDRRHADNARFLPGRLRRAGREVDQREKTLATTLHVH